MSSTVNGLTSCVPHVLVETGRPYPRTLHDSYTMLDSGCARMQVQHTLDIVNGKLCVIKLLRCLPCSPETRQIQRLYQPSNVYIPHAIPAALSSHRNSCLKTTEIAAAQHCSHAGSKLGA